MRLSINIRGSRARISTAASEYKGAPEPTRAQDTERKYLDADGNQ